MVEFLLFCIATVGMTSIITQGVIFLPFRQRIGDWAEGVRVHRERKLQERGGVSPTVPSRSMVEWFSELINCAQCTGFWCGLFCGLFLVTATGNFWFVDDGRFVPEGFWSRAPIIDRDVVNFLLMWFCCGLGGSFLSAFGCNVIDWVFYHKMNALRQLEEQDLALAARHAELQREQEPA